MNKDDENIDWKLKLKYGQLKTAFQHFTLIAEGIVGNLAEGFSFPKGKAFMGMKVWASSSDEAGDMIQKNWGANWFFNNWRNIFL